MPADAVLADEWPLPIDLSSKHFADNQLAAYAWLRENAPVSTGRLSLMRIRLIARYADCRFVLTDERFLRNRARAKGKGDGNPLPLPVPKSVAALTRSMIYEDDPNHRRLRTLVNKAFTQRAVASMEPRIQSITHEILDQLEQSKAFDLIEAFARPVPSKVIAAIVGVEDRDMAEFESGLNVLTRGFSGWGVIKTLLWDFRRTSRFLRALVDEKRRRPGDDLLSGLIEAEEGGDRLSEDELLAMVFLLVVAGFETTQHLIANGAHALIMHPEELRRLRSDPTLWDSGIEEMVRYCGPVHATKPVYPSEDIEIAGELIERGTMVMPLLGSANHDPREFDVPARFDIGRSPNPHLGFGFGAHFCLGKQLATLESKVALSNLFERFADLEMTIPAEKLSRVNLPLWRRFAELPVRCRR